MSTPPGPALRRSLDEIAEAAGYTTGAVYSNFKGKDDLFLDNVDRIVTDRRLLRAELETLRDSAPAGTFDPATPPSSSWSGAPCHAPDLRGTSGPVSDP